MALVHTELEYQMVSQFLVTKAAPRFLIADRTERGSCLTMGPPKPSVKVMAAGYFLP